MASDIEVKKAEYNLRIQDLLRVSFGYKRLYYLPVLRRTTKGAKAKYEGLTALESKFEQKSGFLNTPILMPLKIQISAQGEPLEYYQLPNEPIIEIQNTKDIVKTKLDGGTGTFKERYSQGDYMITIRGIAVDENYDNEDYPEDIMRKLRTLNEMGHHLEVVSPLFTILNIKFIAIEDLKWIPQPGAISMQPYEFTASSDQEYKLTLKKKSQTT